MRLHNILKIIPNGATIIIDSKIFVLTRRSIDSTRHKLHELHNTIDEILLQEEGISLADEVYNITFLPDSINITLKRST